MSKIKESKKPKTKQYYQNTFHKYSTNIKLTWNGIK